MRDGVQLDLPEDVDCTNLDDILEWILLDQSAYFEQCLPQFDECISQGFDPLADNGSSIQAPTEPKDPEITFHFKVYTDVAEPENKTIVRKLSEIT